MIQNEQCEKNPTCHLHVISSWLADRNSYGSCHESQNQAVLYPVIKHGLPENHRIDGYFNEKIIELELNYTNRRFSSKPCLTTCRRYHTTNLLSITQGATALELDHLGPKTYAPWSRYSHGINVLCSSHGNAIAMGKWSHRKI